MALLEDAGLRPTSAPPALQGGTDRPVQRLAEVGTAALYSRPSSVLSRRQKGAARAGGGTAPQQAVPVLHAELLGAFQSSTIEEKRQSLAHVRASLLLTGSRRESRRDSSPRRLSRSGRHSLAGTDSPRQGGRSPRHTGRWAERRSRCGPDEAVKEPRLIPAELPLRADLTASNLRVAKKQHKRLLVGLVGYRNQLRRAAAWPSRPQEDRVWLTGEAERADDLVGRLQSRSPALITTQFWKLARGLLATVTQAAQRPAHADWRAAEGLLHHSALLAELQKDREPSALADQGFTAKVASEFKVVWRVMCIAVHPEDDSVLFVGGGDGAVVRIRVPPVAPPTPDTPAGAPRYTPPTQPQAATAALPGTEEIPFQMVYPVRALCCGRLRRKRLDGDDEIFVCAAGQDKTVRVWNPTRRKLHCIHGPFEAAVSVLLAWRGLLYAALFDYDGVRCLDMNKRGHDESPTIVSTLRRLSGDPPRHDPVHSMEPCGRVLLVGYRSGAIAVFIAPFSAAKPDDPPNLRLGHTFAPATRPTRGVPSHCLRLARWESEGCQGSPPQLETPREPLGHSDAVTAIAAHPDEPRWLYTGSDDTLIIRWDLNERCLSHIMRGHSLPIGGLVACAPDVLASTSLDGRIILWDVQCGAPLQVLHHADNKEVRAAVAIGHGLHRSAPTGFLTQRGQQQQAARRKQLASVLLITGGNDGWLRQWRLGLEPPAVEADPLPRGSAVIEGALDALLTPSIPAGPRGSTRMSRIEISTN